MRQALVAASQLLCLSSAFAAQVLVPPSLPSPPAPSAFAFDAPPAPESAPAPGPYSISGTVVSATTGAPLDRAEVTLSMANAGRTQFAAVTTDETGRFRFDHLAAGKYALQASRRGYLTGGYLEHDQFETAIVTGPNLDAQNIRFPLFPEGIIGGVIIGDSGDPVSGAPVTLYRQVHENGDSRIIVNRSDTTDDTGFYEFSRLRPGTYYIAVSARPWFAFHPNPKNDANGNALPADQQPQSPLDVAYPITFFANATDSASATPITINPGDHTEANLSLHAVPAIHIQIHIPQPDSSGRGANIPQLTTDVFGTEQSRPYPQMFMSGRPDNLVADIGGIAPGHYSLRQFGPQGEVSGSAVDLTSSQTIEFNTTSSNIEVSGKLAMASGKKLPAGITASLSTPGAIRSLAGTVRVDSDGTFDFHSVPPGTYEFEVRSSGEALAVAQMAASGAEVQGSRITVAADAVLLAATLVSGSTTVTGYSQSNGKALGGAMILLIPQDANASPELYRRDQSDSDGSFTLNRVVPGTYTIVAIQDGWTLDWAHPEVIAPYLTRGLKIQISDQQKTLVLPEPVTVQPR